MNVTKITTGIAAATLAATLTLPASAADITRATVIGVHDEQTTAPVIKALHLSHDPAAGGRIAAVQLRSGAYGNGSYALVYVPRNISVHKNDVVELTPADMDLWSNPGKASVIRLHSELTDNR
jgi:hypothetical protein